MKKLIILALSLGAVSCAFAQNFTASTANGYSTGTLSPLFTTDPGFTISGLGVDSAGNVFGIESGNFGGTSDTRLMEWIAASSFTAQTQLFSYGIGGMSGSFVRVSGSKIYFGENSFGTIRSVNLDGSSPATIATVANNYDLAFSGTTAFLSANPGGFASPDNKVFTLNLTNGQLDTILDTGGDYSGPIALDSAGNLLYGATSFGSIATGGIFKFTAAQIAGVRDANPLTNDTALTNGSGVLLYNNGSNGYLARMDDAHLFALQSPFGGAATATRFDLTGTAANQLAGQTDSGPFFGAADATSSALYVAVSSDFVSGPTAVYRVTTVPEPSVTALAGLVTLLAAVPRFFSARKK